jgi:hypothetical protein
MSKDVDAEEPETYTRFSNGFAISDRCMESTPCQHEVIMEDGIFHPIRGDSIYHYLVDHGLPVPKHFAEYAPSPPAPASKKRTLAEVETELEAAQRLKEETKGRIKRLKTEREDHPQHQEHLKKSREEGLKRRLPPYLYEALVAKPMDPEKYGALQYFSISHERHSRRVKKGVYADQLLIDVVFEKQSIEYEVDTENGSWESHDIVIPGHIMIEQRPTCTQQELWDRALKANKGNVGYALVVLCRDCYMLIDDFEDTDVDAPLIECELYRLLQCKLPNVTRDDLIEFYGTDMMADFYDQAVKVKDIDACVKRVNETRDLFAV